MKTQRRSNAIKHAGKEISILSNGSDKTDSSVKEIKLTNMKSKDVTMELDGFSTKYTAVSQDKEGELTIMLKQTDIEMQFDNDSIFTNDSIMSCDDVSVHSQVVNEYGRDIIDNLKKSESTMIGNLDRHEIKSSHRKQMVVWMEEVLRIFCCPTETFFLAVNVMDRYLENSKEGLVLSDLHEIGIAWMFIASKYQEVEPLTLDLMIKKVSHGKITQQLLLKRERKILMTLKFKLAKPSVWTFIENYCELFSGRFESDDYKNNIKQLAIKIAKNGISDRRLSFTVLPSELALCCLIIAIKNYSKSLNRTILSNSFSKAIKNELTSDESIVLQFGKRLRKLTAEATF